MIAGPTTVAADAMIDGFEFVDAGRTFTCVPEPLRTASREEGWWWFRVGGDTRGQRYAPFRTAAGDTEDAVHARVVAYYDDLLARRAMPAPSNHWGRRRMTAAASLHPAPASDTPASTPDAPVA
jgi:hypothetical protein